MHGLGSKRCESHRAGNALGVCAAPGVLRAQEDPLSVPIEWVVLDNGLEVLLQPDRTAARVAVCITYGAV